MLATDGESTRIVANRLAAKFPLQAIIIESREATSTFLRRRLKRLGLTQVAGQIAFQVFSRALAFESRKRKSQIMGRNDWRAEMPVGVPVDHVTSANGRDCRERLQALQPHVVVVSGTRILSSRLLRSIPATFLNIHAGITPRYRGVHGAYWAYARKDAAHAGVTVHTLDAGIDTGEVIAQREISPEHGGQFCHVSAAAAGSRTTVVGTSHLVSAGGPDGDPGRGRAVRVVLSPNTLGLLLAPARGRRQISVDQVGGVYSIRGPAALRDCPAAGSGRSIEGPSPGGDRRTLG